MASCDVAVWSHMCDLCRMFDREGIAEDLVRDSVQDTYLYVRGSNEAGHQGKTIG